MYKLILIKGLSFKYGKYCATKDKPIINVEKTEDMEELINTGYFKLVSAENIIEEVRDEVKKNRDENAETKSKKQSKKTSEANTEENEFEPDMGEEV